MSNFITLTPLTGGLQGDNPNVFSALTTDSLAAVIATGYLTDQGASGANKIKAGDTIVLRYAANTVNEAVTFGYAVTSGDDINFVVGIIGNTEANEFQGSWNAATNTPTLVNPPAASTKGQYYIVSTGGTQFGITFAATDWILSTGAAWVKVDNSENDMLLADGDIYVGSATGVAAAVTMSGDATIINDGTLTIAAGAIDNAKVDASAAVALTKLAAMTVSRAVVSDASGFLVPATTTSTEIGYVNGVTSAIQTQLDSKLAATMTRGAVFTGDAGGQVSQLTIGTTGQLLISDGTDLSYGTIANANVTAAAAIALNKLAAITASVVPVADASGFLVASAVTATELGYVSGVTSALQTQLDAKAPLASPALTGIPTAPTAAPGTNTTQVATCAFVEESVSTPALAEGSIFVGTAGGIAGAVAAGTTGQILTSNGTTVGYVSMSGDATIDAAGALTIAANAIDNAKVDAAAAIDFSKLATLASGNVLVGSAGGVATSVTVTGDITISDAGVTTIGAGAIDLAMLSAGITPSHVVKYAGTIAWSGGGATLSAAVSGVVGTDIINVTWKTKPTESSYVLAAAANTDAIDLELSTANTSNDGVLYYSVLRAAA